MKGLLFAIRLSTGDSLRGFKKWTELFNPFSNGFPPGLAVAGVPPPSSPFPMSKETPVVDKKSEGFLWGVPKFRRTVETRLKRKFGAKEWGWKLIDPNYNILICDNCGHHYKAKHSCRNCYEKTMEETKRIRDAVDEKFGHDPKDKDVVVLYESDKARGLGMDPSQNFSNKLIVEFPKERPTFFSPNLLQKSTVGVNKKRKDISVTDPTPIVHKSE